MRHIAIHLVLALATGLSFVVGVCGQDEKPANAPPPGVEDVYLARDDGKGKAGDEVKEFRTTDVPIWCVVMLDASGKVTVNMNFVAVKVAGVRPETKVVSTSYTTKENQNRVNFNGRPDGTWTPGRYRVDVFVDGKPAKAVEFEIKGPAADSAKSNGFGPPTAPPRSKPQKKPSMSNIAGKPAT